MENTKIVGNYDMVCNEIPQMYSYWEFKEDGKAIQDDVEKGIWFVKDDILIITYHNKEYGHTVLSFEDENTLVGENIWRTGHKFTWILRKVADESN